MSQKSKQKSRSKSQLEDYAFPPSPQSQLFEHYAQFRDDEPALGPVLGHPSPSERKQQLLDKELELVKQEKETFALELEVLRLRQVLGPATPPNYIGSAMCDWKVWHKEKDHRLAAGLCSRYVNKSWVQFFRFTIFCCRLFGVDSNLWYGIERANARHTRSSYGQSH